MEVYEYPGYRCGPCPPGLQGNGTHCRDIDEVGAPEPGVAQGAGGGIDEVGAPEPGMAQGAGGGRSERPRERGGERWSGAERWG